MLKEFYNYGGLLECPYKKLLKEKYKKEQEHQQEKESGLI
jgi:hypothetical protein